MQKINARIFLIKYLLASQAGFSLIEALMAVLVVSILMTAILPMLVLSTATRVQSRRVDLATQAARSYIDGVRSGAIDIIDAPNGVSTYPTFPFIGGAQTNRNQYFSDVPAPQTTTNVTDLNLIPGVKVAMNGNSFSVNDPQNLVIQPMRSCASCTSSDLANQGFYMEVRVYRADAFTLDALGNLTGIKSGLTLEPQNATTYATNCGNSGRVVTATNGSQICPLVIMKVDINPTTSTLSNIKTRL